MASEQPSVTIEMPPFHNQLDEILGVQITANNISSCANEALDQVIDLTHKVTETYIEQHPQTTLESLALEDAAFEEYGMDNINIVLDHLAKMVDGLNAIDIAKNNSTRADFVITPPDSNRAGIQPVTNEKSFVRRRVDKVKAALFVLNNSFDIDISNNEQIAIVCGVTPGEIVRHESYYFIWAKQLRRMILVCDEVENTTYVFDESILIQHDLTSDKIMTMKKAELDKIIAEIPKAGQRIRYDERSFVGRLQLATAAPGMPTGTAPRERPKGVHLYPPAPADVKTVKPFAAELGISHKATTDIIETLVASGIIKWPQKFMFRTNSGSFYQGYGLTDGHIRAIKQQAREQHLLVPKATGDVASLKSIVKALASRDEYVKAVYHQLVDAEKIPEAEMVKFFGQAALGYTLDMRIAIAEHFAENSRGEKTRRRAAEYLATLLQPKTTRLAEITQNDATDTNSQ